MTVNQGEIGRTQSKLENRQLVNTWLPALFLVLCAAFMRFVITPELEMLPANYSHLFTYTAESKLREKLNAPWNSTIVTVRQVAQTLTVSGEIAIIQNDLYWYKVYNGLIFQSTGLYGVDRHTFANLPGYGNANRNGQFLFPTHVKKNSYIFWDAMYIGPRQAEFVKVETINGMPVYQFHFTGKNMDETAGYTSMPEVPEKFQVLTNGEGTLWIEPLTGLLLDVEETGVSYFVDPVTGKDVQDFFSWRDTFSDETRASQLNLAHKERNKKLLFEVLLPVLLLALGLIWLLYATKQSHGKKFGNKYIPPEGLIPGP